MTGTDQNPRGPDPYRDRGVGEMSRDDDTWEPAPTDVPAAGGDLGNWGVFAGVILTIAGFGHVLLGIVALFDASYFDAAESDPVLPIGYTAWGWIHVVLGAVLLAAGSGMLKGQAWARIVAIVFAVVNAIGAMAMVPSAPVWALLLIAMDVLIVFALTVHHPRVAGRDESSSAGTAH
jgi:hypothetical protein